MSKNYDDYKPINPMPPRRRKNPMLSFVQYSIIALLCIALIVSGAYFMSVHNSSSDNAPDGGQTPVTPPEDQGAETDVPETEGQETDVPPEITEPVVPVIDLDRYTEVEMSKDMIHKGSLIYVSGNYKAVYPAADELVSFLGKKTASYMISSNTMTINKDIIPTINEMIDAFANETGHKDVIVWTGYRDEARQTQVYNEYVAKHGEEAAKTAVAKPGESDHHTALGIALKVYRNNTPYHFSEFEGYNWLEENCYKYGFVERYPADKVDVTGIDYSSSNYFRYVGEPHAEYIYKNGKCLEEYLILLKDYTFGNAHFDYTTENGDVYEIYFVRAESESDTDTVSVPVPKEGEYTVSGNNMDGFIVTVKR